MSKSQHLGSVIAPITPKLTNRVLDISELKRTHENTALANFVVAGKPVPVGSY